MVSPNMQELRSTEYTLLSVDIVQWYRCQDYQPLSMEVSAGQLAATTVPSRCWPYYHWGGTGTGHKKQRNEARNGEERRNRKKRWRCPRKGKLEEHGAWSVGAPSGMAVASKRRCPSGRRGKLHAQHQGCLHWLRKLLKWSSVGKARKAVSLELEGGQQRKSGYSEVPNGIRTGTGRSGLEAHVMCVFLVNKQLLSMDPSLLS